MGLLWKCISCCNSAHEQEGKNTEVITGLLELLSVIWNLLKSILMNFAAVGERTAEFPLLRWEWQEEGNKGRKVNVPEPLLLECLWQPVGWFHISFPCRNNNMIFFGRQEQWDSQPSFLHFYSSEILTNIQNPKFKVTLSVEFRPKPF